jgi:hypothetical protein
MCIQKKLTEAKLFLKKFYLTFLLIQKKKGRSAGKARQKIKITKKIFFFLKAFWKENKKLYFLNIFFREQKTYIIINKISARNF